MATEIATRSPAFVDGKAQNAQELRLHALSSGGGATPLASRGGIRPSGGQPGLVAALATPVMKVRVNAGIADIPSASATGGVYRVSWDQVDLDIDPSSAQARTDLVIVEVVDTGTAAATGKVRILKGAAGAGRPGNPVANAHWLALGAVAVRVGAESSGNIRTQDVTPEPRYAVAPGAGIPVSSQVELDALTGVYDGLSVKRLDLGGVREDRVNGTWRRASQTWVSRVTAPAGYNVVVSNTTWAVLFAQVGQNFNAAVDVPSAGQLEAEWKAPLCICPPGTGLQVRLRIGSTVIDSGYLSADTVQVAGPMQLADHLDFAAAAVGVQVVLEAQRVGAGAGQVRILEMAGGTTPRLRSRFTS